MQILWVKQHGNSADDDPEDTSEEYFPKIAFFKEGKTVSDVREEQVFKEISKIHKGVGSKGKPDSLAVHQSWSHPQLERKRSVDHPERFRGAFKG